MFLGDGVHIPLARGGGGTDGSGPPEVGSALDLRAGGYFEGGLALDARLTTASTATHLGWDHLRGDGLAFETSGSHEQEKLDLRVGR